MPSVLSLVVKMTIYTRIMLGYLAVVAAGELCRIDVSLLLPFVLFCLFIFLGGELCPSTIVSRSQTLARRRVW